MAPAGYAEDYYHVLEVEQTAKLDQITKAYRRLARERHPDKDKSPSATQRFQLLNAAYETLTDPVKRTAYDQIYHLIRRTYFKAQTQGSPTSNVDPAIQSQLEADAREILEITATQDWRNRQRDAETNMLSVHIAARKKRIRDGKQQIAALTMTDLIEAFWEAVENITTCLLSLFFVRVEYDEASQERKSREREERAVKKKEIETWVADEKALLRKEEERYSQVMVGRMMADYYHKKTVNAIKARMKKRIQDHEVKQRKEREAEENIPRAQREEQQRKAEQQAEDAARARAEEFTRYQESKRPQSSDQVPASSTSSCVHSDSGWSKVEGPLTCPKCQIVWTYLIFCPRCNIEACRQCQIGLRPSGQANQPNTSAYRRQFT